MIHYYCEKNELKRGTDGSAGYDLVCDNGTEKDMNHAIATDGSISLEPGSRLLVNTNLYLAMPRGVAGMVCSRSGLAINSGVVVLNAPGIIDSDYRGEVKVCLANLGNRRYVVHPGDRVAQIVFTHYIVELRSSVVDNEPVQSYGMDGILLERVGTFEDWSERFGGTPRGAGGHGSTGR